MALLWIDGFEGYGTVGAPIGVDLRYPILSIGNMGIAAGRITGYSLNQNYSGSYITTPAITTDLTLVAGVAFYAATIQGWASLQFFDNTAQGISVTFYPTVPSTVVVKLGATVLDTVTLESSLMLNTWYYIEVKVFCHATSGTVEVKLDGTTIESLTGINTQGGTNLYNNKVRCYWAYSYVDDFYICDGSGSTLNDFQGVCRVIGLFPNADTTTIQWTPSTGTTHYDLVDENPENTTDYVSTSTQADTDLYTYPSLIGTGTILGVQVSSTVNLAAGVSLVFQAPIVSSGTTDIGPDTVLTSVTYSDVRHISITDPHTGQPWTISGLAAAQIGVKVM